MIEVLTDPTIDTNRTKLKWLDIPYADYSDSQKRDICLHRIIWKGPALIFFIHVDS